MSTFLGSDLRKVHNYEYGCFNFIPNDATLESSAIKKWIVRAFVSSHTKISIYFNIKNYFFILHNHFNLSILLFILLK